MKIEIRHPHFECVYTFKQTQIGTPHEWHNQNLKVPKMGNWNLLGLISMVEPQKTTKSFCNRDSITHCSKYSQLFCEMIQSRPVTYTSCTLHSSGQYYSAIAYFIKSSNNEQDLWDIFKFISSNFQKMPATQSCVASATVFPSAFSIKLPTQGTYQSLHSRAQDGLWVFFVSFHLQIFTAFTHLIKYQRRFFHHNP